MRRKLPLSLGLSVLAHGALYGGVLGYFAWEESRAERAMDIDLAGSSLIRQLANPGSRPAQRKPPEPWILSSGRFAPAPKPQALSATAQSEEIAGPACPPPCPETPGDWVPASSASRLPSWSSGLITEDDYPQEARRAGAEGRVVVDVLIDAQGVVKGVTLVQGSRPEFDKLVLERLKVSRFRPAMDPEGNAIACRLRLPVAFELR
jgi:protein TonB